MYKQHPYRYDGKFYANVDGNMVEISKEIAQAMDAHYKRWVRQQQADKKNEVIVESAFGNEVDEYEVMNTVPDENADVEKQVLEQIEYEELHKKINRLSSEERFLIYGIYFENLPYQKIADLLGITKGTVSKKLQKVLQKMRAMYEEEN